jgi:cobalamin biosynthetic protein CobC
MKHGGDLSEAVRRFGGDPAGWLDLSTGISPHAYPFDPPGEMSWKRLPQPDKLEALLAAARRAYGAPAGAPILAVPGTQLLIQLLPVAKPAARVAVVGPTYGEHARCWARAGSLVASVAEPEAGGGADVVVLGNPNNPDGRTFEPARLLGLAEAMGAQGGLMIVDEAFADVAPQLSLAGYAGVAGLVVLRSFGKVFGLAGLRLGFALGPADLMERLAELIGPWTVSGAALEIGLQALGDQDWQRSARSELARLAVRLDALLAAAGFDILGGTALFRLASHRHAAAIHQHLAQQTIWVRRFDDHPYWLRFGLPGGDAEFERLAAGLSSFDIAGSFSPRA